MELVELLNAPGTYNWVPSADLVALKLALTPWWEVARQTVSGWKQEFDPFIWLLGSVLAMIPGTFVIYKWWHYRNSRLPERLNELLAKEELRLREARSALLKVVKHPTAVRASVAAPYFVVPALKQTVRNCNWAGWLSPFPFATAERELELALVEIEHQLDFCEKSRADTRRQEATAYVVKGAIAAARASRSSVTPQDFDHHNRVALNHFMRALEIDQNDIEALEYAAHQYRILDQHELALSSYARLISLTSNGNSDLQLVAARAHRYRAEIYEKKHALTKIGARLSDAKDCLREALAMLPDGARGQIDDASIHEVLGRIEKAIGATTLPGTHFGAALSIYGEIKQKDPTNQDAIDGHARVEMELREFYAP